MCKRLYLVAEAGHRTAFKITTASVVSNLDFIFDELAEKFDTTEWIRKEYGHHERYAANYICGGWCVYTSTLDDLEVDAKKLKDKEWKQIVKDYYYNEGELE